jgi:UTP--glucose-1-phosphate uridylyltransferase
LLALRSDAYEILPDGQVRLHESRQGKPPLVMLSDEYKLVDSLDGLGVPGLLRCESLTISGPVKFAPGVVMEGKVEVRNASGSAKVLAAGTYKDQTVEW